jgi:hypothetical protein
VRKRRKQQQLEPEPFDLNEPAACRTFIRFTPGYARTDGGFGNLHSVGLVYTTSVELSGGRGQVTCVDLEGDYAREIEARMEQNPTKALPLDPARFSFILMGWVAPPGDAR